MTVIFMTYMGSVEEESVVYCSRDVANACCVKNENNFQIQEVRFTMIHSHCEGLM